MLYECELHKKIGKYPENNPLNPERTRNGIHRSRLRFGWKALVSYEQDEVVEKNKKHTIHPKPEQKVQNCGTIRVEQLIRVQKGSGEKIGDD